MVMDRLGGFRLCRRLLDTEETLSPFLSAEAMVGRGAGRLEQRRGGGHRCVVIGRTGGAMRTQVPVGADQTENNLQTLGSHLTPDTKPCGRDQIWLSRLLQEHLFLSFICIPDL